MVAGQVFCLIGLLTSGIVGHFNETPLNGKHLRVIPMELAYIVMTERNETGAVVKASGVLPLMLQLLSEHLHFTYSYSSAIAPFSDDSPNRRGAISYIRSGEVDLLLGANIPLPSRYKYVDYPAAWKECPFSIMIPIPKPSVNAAAFVRPFSQNVWIAIGVAIPSTIISLHLFTRWYAKMLKDSHPLGNQQVTNQFVSLDGVVLYVFACLLSQATMCVNNMRVVRIIAATWALVCFVIVHSYSTTLVSFLTSPDWKPVIETMYDLPNVPGLQITVDKDYEADIIISRSTSDVGIHSVMRNMLMNNPDLRCKKHEDCLDKVRSGFHVFIDREPIISGIIYQDLKESNKCSFTMARDNFDFSPIFLNLPKNSAYTEYFSRAILHLRENGFLIIWERWFHPKPTECLNKNYMKKPEKQPSLTLENFYGAFIVLITGYTLSLMVFGMETLQYYYYMRVQRVAWKNHISTSISISIAESSEM